MKTKKSMIGPAIAVLIAMIIVAIVGAYFIAKANLEKDFTPPPSGEALFTVEYTGPVEKEGDTPTTASLTFYDDGNCRASGKISGIYDWTCDSTWTAGGELSIAGAEGIKAECKDEQTAAILPMLGLETAYDLNVQFTAAGEGEDMRITALGLDAASGIPLMQCEFALSAEQAAKLGL